MRFIALFEWHKLFKYFWVVIVDRAYFLKGHVSKPTTISGARIVWQWNCYGWAKEMVGLRLKQFEFIDAWYYMLDEIN